MPVHYVRILIHCVNSHIKMFGNTIIVYTISYITSKGTDMYKYKLIYNHTHCTRDMLSCFSIVQTAQHGWCDLVDF
jgi:hypothetical protein